MIGGPNQSHKVNFKEPPHRGKISSKNFYDSSVNYYSGISNKPQPRNSCLRSLIRLTVWLSPTAQESKGGRNMNRCRAASRPFFNLNGTLSYFSIMERLIANILTNKMRPAWGLNWAGRGRDPWLPLGTPKLYSTWKYKCPRSARFDASRGAVRIRNTDARVPQAPQVAKTPRAGAAEAPPGAAGSSNPPRLEVPFRDVERAGPGTWRRGNSLEGKRGKKLARQASKSAPKHLIKYPKSSINWPESADFRQKTN